jgi:hypothetical protein
MSGILSSLQGILGSLQSKAQGVIDSLFPPEKRAEVLARLQAFVISNPKLSAFLLSNIALTGLPLIMFGVFTITVFVFSLVAALLIGVLAALLFTVFMVGVALLVVIPTVFITTMGATFLFLWGLGGYYILKWFNEGESPAPEGSAIGDTLNNLTGGRMSFLMDGVRKKEAQGASEKKSNGTANGGVPDVAKNADIGNVKDQATKNVDGVQKRVGKATGGATNAVGTAKGAVGGVTGLT